MTRSCFVHLRIHTEFSLQEGILRIPELMQKLIEFSMPAVALTDLMNLFAVVKFYQAALAKGIKPLIGCELIYQKTPDTHELFSLVALCQNLNGYKNLTQLVSRAYEEGQIHGKPRIILDWLCEHAEGLIFLSGGMQGDIGQALLEDKPELALTLANFWKNKFPKQFYLEIQRIGHLGEANYNSALVHLADTLQLPLVATNLVCFLTPEDYGAHEARICINQGRILTDSQRVKSHRESQYLKSMDEMLELFHDLPQALENTLQIAKRCNLILPLGTSFLPNFPIPTSMTVDDFLCQQAQRGLEARFPQLSGKYSLETYQMRLKTELEVIINMGFPGYFLIVADFIEWAKKNHIPVGPGRGSGAGSLVAYVLGITNLDPLEYDLLFERFLNPERISMPDFDIDFCMEGRDRVIEYVAERYGKNNVAQIITFGTMAAKAVVRDVGRVLGYPYTFVDKIAKLIPFEIGITLEAALSQEPELYKRYQEDEDVSTLLNLAKKLEGITKNAGKHAGGVVIAPSRLTDFTAIYCEENSSQKVSQFDKDDVEAVGLVKFDFLGLRTLTIIDETIKNIHHLDANIDIDISDIPLDDQDTFKLLQSGYTTAIFQLESRGMQELIKRLQPDCFEDIIALVALFRPGPLQSGMVDDFIDRKQGHAKIVYLHPELENILKPTYGVILYQEQVMQIAQILANYTLGAADLLRRAMGKKKPEEMAKQRDIFLHGAQQKKIDQEIASQIFDLMEKFAGYGFNKSHSAAYAMLSYQTAWLKSHFPAPFMAAVLSADMDNTDKVVHMLTETRRMLLKIIPPSINHSYYRFHVSPHSSNSIYYGLGAIKGIGEAAVELIVSEREHHGPYQSLQQFCKRLDLRKINKRVLEALIKSGAFDDFNVKRATLWNQLENTMKVATIHWTNQQNGQQNLFDYFEEESSETDPMLHSWSLKELLDGEKETLGWYLSGHPANEAVQEFDGFCISFKEFGITSQKIIRLSGMIQAWKKILTKKKKTLILVTLAQEEGEIELILFPEHLLNHTQEFSPGDLVVIEAELSIDRLKQQKRAIIQKIMSIEDARCRYAKYLQLHLQEHHEQTFIDFKKFIKMNPGDCPIVIQLCTTHFSVRMSLGLEWSWHPSQKNMETLKKVLNDVKMEMVYPKEHDA